ncbi:hypothetical protein [Amphritea sp.]|uniref:hypothetical protein n=1 Tax=Amphritea sp. TaxID=1872502 RepID=UPI0025BB289A|nr:hypothetical protein [Amphritea sp.]
MKIAVSFSLLLFTTFSYAGCGVSNGSASNLSTDQECSSGSQVNQNTMTHCTDESAVQYAKQFYRDHYGFFSEQNPRMADQLYTADFKEVITNHAECVGDNGVCNLHFDPWLNAQDGYADGEIDYSVQKLDAKTLSVDLNYQFRVHSTLPARPQTVSLLLKRAKTGECWKLDDMLLPDRTSMKVMMRNDYEHFYYYKKTRLSWNLLSSDIDSSNIQVVRANQVVATYVLNCDLSEALTPDPEQLDGEMNKIGLVVTPSKPKGFVITSCRVGAHSKQLAVYDLESDRQDPVWEKTGSYFGEWSVNQNYDLVLSYDEPCDEKKCDAPFVQRDLIWGVSSD